MAASKLCRKGRSNEEPVPTRAGASVLRPVMCRIVLRHGMERAKWNGRFYTICGYRRRRTQTLNTYPRISVVHAPLGFTVSKKNSDEYSSPDLVQDFLYYTGDLSVESAAEIAGVSTATLTRWRMMGARQLRSDVRRRLLRYVSQREKGKGSVRQAA